MAPTSPVLEFFFKGRGGLVFLAEDLDLWLQRKRESKATETEMAATTAPVVLTGAIFRAKAKAWPVNLFRFLRAYLDAQQF